MRKQIWLERIGLFCLFLTLITGIITITINFRPLYVWDIQQLNILDVTQLSQVQLLKNFDLLMGFLNNPFNQTLALPDFPMSVAGAGHFYDVKKLFLLNYGVLLVTLIPSILYLYHMVSTKRVWRWIRPFQWGMVIPLLLAGVMAVGFDQFFIKFHELFFSNNDWLFNPATDPIITVLPEAFFMHCFILFFVLIELVFLAFYLWGKISLKKIRHTDL